jgi:hypothetical protein
VTIGFGKSRAKVTQSSVQIASRIPIETRNNPAPDASDFQSNRGLLRIWPL